MKKILPILFITFTLTSCQSQTMDLSIQYKGDTYIGFDDLEEANKYKVSNGFGNGGMFLSRWDKENVKLNNGIGELSLYDKDNINYGSELRSLEGFQYGYFGGRVKTFKKSGTVQSIFTYNGGRYAHDEIDIEFLGKNTTKVQFNYYHNGVGGHEYLYDLGFDSSEEYHDYGFKWEKDRITWFVDFVAVYQVRAKLPQWGYFYINVWAGTSKVKNWLGEYVSDNDVHTACYDYLSYAPLE